MDAKKALKSRRKLGWNYDQSTIGGKTEQLKTVISLELINFHKTLRVINCRHLELTTRIIN